MRGALGDSKVCGILLNYAECVSSGVLEQKWLAN